MKDGYYTIAEHLSTGKKMEVYHRKKQVEL